MRAYELMIIFDGDLEEEAVAASLSKATATYAREQRGLDVRAGTISTVDLATPDGGQIPIEERSDREVTHIGPSRLTPEGARIRNPAFDVTPAKFITAIVTERGIARAPYSSSLADLCRSRF